jgi:site-specific DNA-methyltransferase (adenine-specific)
VFHSESDLPTNHIIHGENLRTLRDLPSGLARLVYIDPPFNTGVVQRRDRIKVTKDTEGKRKGFAGRTYAVERTASASFPDRHDDYIAFIVERVREAIRCTTDDASLFIHVDPRESHYVKVALDGVFGRASFMNEIVWSYDYGGRSKKRWSQKHDVILWYARNPKRYVYRYEDIDRIPYMAPKLAGAEKAARGKTPTDVWWQTIVPTRSAEKTGYPTQKPLAILERIVCVHSDPGDVVLDFFAGSGTTGEAAAKHGRRFVLVDQSADAVAVMKTRLSAYRPRIGAP